MSKNFFESREWRELRYFTIRHYGFKCMACRASNTELHVDHIKPRSRFPSLALEFDNLQVLCKDCNLGKSNKYSDDLRPWSHQRAHAYVRLRDYFQKRWKQGSGAIKDKYFEMAIRVCVNHESELRKYLQQNKVREMKGGFCRDSRYFEQKGLSK